MQQLYQDSMAMEAVLDLRPVGVGRERNKKCRGYQVPHNGPWSMKSIQLLYMPVGGRSH